MSNYVITIDGPSGVGKSTLAKALAKKLDISYLDTGAMYRSLALLLSESREYQDNGLSEDLLVKFLARLNFSMKNKALLCNNQALSPKLYNEEIASISTQVATYPVVRKAMQKNQVEIARSNSLVADGRDLGTKVFPHALCKIFLDAKAEVRAERRFNELVTKGVTADLVLITKQMAERDANDRSRSLDPLVAAVDAIHIDSSHLGATDLLNKVFSLVQVKLALAFTHLDESGNVCMVNVGEKQASLRKAVVEATVIMSSTTLNLLKNQALPKGDVLTTAKIAGIMAAKKCADLIPMCHPLGISYADVSFKVVDQPPSIIVQAEVQTDAKTGVEMEALVACQIACATIYDMCKAVQKDIVITNTRLRYKSGGKSGEVKFD